jgi:hypothetical protein
MHDCLSKNEKKVVEIPNGEIPNDNPLPNTKRQMNKPIF